MQPVRAVVVRIIPTLHQPACMKPFLTLSIALIVPYALLAQTVAWAGRFGANSFDRGYAIAADAAGNSYITGYFRNTVAFGSTTLSATGGADTYVAKLGPDGEVLWAVKAGSSEGLDQGNAIAVDAAGNCYVAGQFSSTATFGSFTLTATGNVDAFMAKLNSEGVFVWVRAIGGNAGDISYGIAADAAGNSYVVGGFSGTAVFGTTTLVSSTTEVFIAKLDPAGNFLWAQKAGGGQADEARSIALDAAGNCYVTGQVGSLGPAGGTATFGGITLTLAGDEDVFVTKLDANGDFLWAKQAGGSARDMGQGLSTDAAGNCYLTGYFGGTATFGTVALTSASANERDVFVAKLDPDGNWQWAVRAGGTAEDGGTGIATDAAGTSRVVGSFGGSATFGATELTATAAGAVFLAELDAEGTFVSAIQAGGGLNEMRNGAIAIDPAGNTYLTGWFRGEAQFGDTTLSASGSNDDIFVLKLADGATSIGDRARTTAPVVIPNPASGMLHIRTEERVHTVDIHDGAGALVRTETRASFSVEQLPAGLYLLRVRTGTGMHIVRVVKE